MEIVAGILGIGSLVTGLVDQFTISPSKQAAFDAADKKLQADKDRLEYEKQHDVLAAQLASIQGAQKKQQSNSLIVVAGIVVVGAVATALVIQGGAK